MIKIILTAEQEDEIVVAWLQDILDTDCGSNHPEDIEDWERCQEAAKVLLWPLTEEAK